MRNWINIVIESATEYAYHSTSASLDDIATHGLLATEWDDEEIAQIVDDGVFYLIFYTDEPQTEYGDITLRFALGSEYTTGYSSDRGAFIYSDQPFSISASHLEYYTNEGWKSFNSLTESKNRDNILYHGTCLPHLAYIFEGNSMTAGSDDVWGGEAGVSFTTDYQIAKNFAYRSMEPYEMEYDDSGFRQKLGEIPNSVVVLAVSRQDLVRGQYRVEDYRDSDADEKEVRVLSDEISPIISLLRKVEVDKRSIAWWVRYTKLTKDKSLLKALLALEAKLS